MQKSNWSETRYCCVNYTFLYLQLFCRHQGKASQESQNKSNWSEIRYVLYDLCMSLMNYDGTLFLSLIEPLNRTSELSLQESNCTSISHDFLAVMIKMYTNLFFILLIMPSTHTCYSAISLETRRSFTDRKERLVSKLLSDLL